MSNSEISSDKEEKTLDASNTHRMALKIELEIDSKILDMIAGVFDRPASVPVTDKEDEDDDDDVKYQLADNSGIHFYNYCV